MTTPEEPAATGGGPEPSLGLEGRLRDVEEAVAALSEHVADLDRRLPAVGPSADRPESFDDWLAYVSDVYYLPHLPQQVRDSSALRREWSALWEAWTLAWTTGTGWDKVAWHRDLRAVIGQIGPWESRRRDAQISLAAGAGAGGGL
jgi:hypothetical protein